MTISRVNPTGWAPFEEFTAAQANGLDTNLVKAVDGVGGGVYNPSAPIDIEGDGGGSGFGLEADNFRATTAQITTGTIFNATVTSIVSATQLLIQSTHEWVNDPAGDTSQFDAFTTSSYVKPSSGGFVDIFNTQAGDLVLVNTFLQGFSDSGGSDGVIRMYVIEDQGGTPSEIAIDSTRWVLSPSSVQTSGNLAFRHTVTNAGTLRVGFEGKITTTGTCRLRGAQAIIAALMR